MTIQEMKQLKQERGYTYAQIADLSGVPLGTVQKIFNGETKSPRYDTLTALERVFAEPMVVRETSAYGAERKPGTYTIDDYRALPDEQRVELIDGYFYDMASPTTFHQLMAGEVYRQVANYIMEQGGACTPFISPIDVQLDNDEKTMIQPDVIIVCNPDQIERRNIMGAPDFVLEVISPGTKHRDYITKLYKYEQAGVHEYWIVDPYKKRVLVYFFKGEVSPAIYPIDADIPVNIYEGKLTLKFQQIAKWAVSVS
ncbi:Uma2 family endonuclease [Murimonas intestini]|uniref:Uma2 family endonuclease n=1 Tax=Murimonas intestini TaxID=1337051 RepID=A0AB73T1I2_9FIRM|nr:Uma2 family endonuclease [Murimonas intestini]MCR1840408.1 Uma2 family endonuclease [Murimonas intestini]MCR1867481.1 Uma2 family endonuclease [Murimonas intestini]MCR1884668.1 Uma2 family endonuclease [Murimonas intestini]